MLINVTRSSMPSFEEYCEEIKSIWETVHLTNMGPIHNKLKEQINDYLKGMTLNMTTNQKGYVLICVNGISIGWGKDDGRIIKNLFPKGLRML